MSCEETEEIDSKSYFDAALLKYVKLRSKVSSVRFLKGSRSILKSLKTCSWLAADCNLKMWDDKTPSWEDSMKKSYFLGRLPSYLLIPILIVSFKRLRSLLIEFYPGSLDYLALW